MICDYQNRPSRVASAIQSASLPDSNLTKAERQALKRLKTDCSGRHPKLQQLTLLEFRRNMNRGDILELT